MDEYQKVEITDDLPRCDKAEAHYWMHDWILLTFPWEKEDPFPYFWRCIACDLKIRTRVPLPKFVFKGNLIEGSESREERP